MVLVCAVISAMIVAAGNGLSSNANPQGHAVPFQSGYLSCCDASEVGASWVVPRLLPPAATSVGREAAWIGAQTGSSFFVQIGTIEEHAERGSTYEAFWSDLQVSELPITIPHALRPGDEVLAVLRREPTRWVAQLRDVTRRWTFTRRIPSSAAAQLGEWLDEDIVATALGPPTEQDQVLPMLPTDRALRFRHLTLDGLPPGQLTASGFIDDTGHALVPVRDGGGDGFTVVRRAGA
ncbi:MAG TPA: hypothetical protein VKT18_09490 [Acidimicrobiales bacterium]|nr:hypothetical protein [Acidimicrobiales bacterium]